jgi:ABC-2 type transport system permease protein
VREAAFFLIRCSVRNWARGLLRQLRNPRYAIAVLIGIGYLALVRFGQPEGGRGAPPSGAVMQGGSIFLALLVAKWWLFGADRLALAFSPAEIQFLFPAPVSRAALLGFKLVRAQKLILVNVLVWTLLLHRSGGALAAAAYGISLWVFFSTLFFHRLGTALVRDSLTIRGRAGLRRAWPVVGVLLVLGAVVWLTLAHLEAQSPTTAPVDWWGRAALLIETPPLRWLLFPFTIPLLPLGARQGDWLPRFLLALGVLAAHVVWIVRADRAFEEAAIDASARREALLERWRRHGATSARAPGGTRRWIRLSPSGHPVLAIVWKNVTRLVRSVSAALVAFVVVVLTLAVVLSLTEGGENPGLLAMIASLTLGWAGALAIVGPLWVRIDIRGELDVLPLLRTWPLSGATLMTGEVLSSTIVLTALQAVLGAVGLLALAQGGQLLVPAPQLAMFAAVSLAVLSGINSVAICIQNGAALLYPSWVQTEIRPGGIEQMGQHLLTAGISLLLLILAAAGPALVGGGAAYLLRPLLDWWALVPAGVLAAAGLGLESFLLLDWLGDRFERLDPSALHS